MEKQGDVEDREEGKEEVKGNEYKSRWCKNEEEEKMRK